MAGTSQSCPKTTNPRTARRIVDEEANAPRTRPPRLLSNEQIPKWHAREHILASYRPVTRSLRSCLASLAYLHNDTANIYSHLLATAALVVLEMCIPQYFTVLLPQAPRADRLAMKLYTASAVTCFAVSTVHHILRCHSRLTRDLWVQFEYLAVLVHIVVSIGTEVYIGFYCEPGLKNMYFSMLSMVICVTNALTTNPFAQSISFPLVRNFGFAFASLWAFAPMIHAATIFPYDQLENQVGLRYCYVEVAILAVAILIYATKFPECWKPGMFDIWGASHQIFHILVVVAVATHLCGILSAYRWNYDHPRCQSTAQ